MHATHATSTRGGDDDHGLAVQTVGLGKAFGDVPVLRGLDLRVPRGAVVGFLGANGAGKTTTIRLLLGLLTPDEGTGRVLGLDVVDDSLAVRRRVGYLPQHPAFPAGMTARQVLRLAAGFFFTGPRRAVDARVDQALELVGLSSKGDRLAAALSGGERQRLGLAQAWIHEPELLILDEPAAALDPLGRRDVLALLRRLRETATVFFSTHILDDVQRVSDSVVILHRGRAVAQGPIDEVLDGATGRVGTDVWTYETTVSADVPESLRVVRDRLVDQPWVLDVSTCPDDSAFTWRVQVGDEQQADAHLLRLLLADDAVRVLRHVRVDAARRSLEDVFVDVVSGADGDLTGSASAGSLGADAERQRSPHGGR